MLKNIASGMQDKISLLSEKMADSYFSEFSITQFGIQKKENIEEMRVGFVIPLLKILIEYLRSSRRELLYIYLDERKRYSPHLSTSEIQLSYHTYMVKADYRILCDILLERAPKYEDWMALHAPLISINNNTVKVLAVGDCLMNEVRVFSNPSYFKKDFSIDFRCIYFSANSSGGLNSESILEYVNANNIDIVSFSFFSFEALPEYSRIISHAEKMTYQEIEHFCDGMISQVQLFLIGLRAQTNKTFLVHNVSGLPLGRWRKYLPLIPPMVPKKKNAVKYLNEKLIEVIRNIENIILVDELSVSIEKGIKHCAKEIAPQRKYHGMFHTSYFGVYLSEIYIQEAEAYLSLKKCKAILVDFDNTLWSGVMADGEVKHFTARQQLLKELKNVGIILVAVSKNTEENIRWHEMLLKREDFAFLQIHWNPKAESVSATVGALNIGKDSFVFIDDNRHERALVADAHPDVIILDAEADSTWVALERLKSYPNTQATEEAMKRTAMYQEQAARNAALAPVAGSLENLSALGLWYTFNEAKLENIERVLELINRTNQFNLTTIRYSKKEVLEFYSSKRHLVFTSSLGDKFGDLGLVAVIVVALKEEGVAEIDTFVMSCRAMGFSLEKALINEVVFFLRNKGFTKVYGRYVPSDRNSPSASLYSGAKFALIEENYYCAAVEAFNAEIVSWLSRV